MGRTVLPFTQELYREEESWKSYRRALRREDRAMFDELFAAARYHTAACTCSGRAVPFEAILMSILLEERRAVRELSARLAPLPGRGAGPPPPPAGGAPHPPPPATIEFSVDRAPEDGSAASEGAFVRGSPCGKPARLRFTSLRPSSCGRCAGSREPGARRRVPRGGLWSEVAGPASGTAASGRRSRA